MLPAGLDPPELLQTSDLNQPPLETFLRTGTKLSMIIQLNHHWCLLQFWLGRDLRSSKSRYRIIYRNKDCMPGHAVLQLWRIRSVVSDQTCDQTGLKTTSEWWSQINQFQVPSISSRLQLEESAISISRDFFGTMWKNQPQIAWLFQQWNMLESQGALQRLILLFFSKKTIL